MITKKMSKNIDISTKPNDVYKITLKDNPTTGFSWEFVCDHPDTTREIEREVIPGNIHLRGSPSTLIITFQSLVSDSIKFYHVRKWLNNDLNNIVPEYVFNIVIEKDDQ